MTNRRSSIFDFFFYGAHLKSKLKKKIWQKKQKVDGGNVKLVNRQFNSPMGLYSEENIAETLSSQAEVLSQGVLG